MKKLVLPILASMFLVISCSKNYSSGPGPYASSQSVFDSLGPLTTTATIDAGTGGSFKSKNGALYVFSANSLKTSSGAVVAGNVLVTTTEYFTRSDMMSSQVYPVNNGDPLVSSGEFNISVKQGDNELSLMPPNTFQVFMPRPDTSTGMQLYYGKPDSGALGRINWQLNTDSTKGALQYMGDNIVITSTVFNYHNADKPLVSTKPAAIYRPDKITPQTFTISLTSTEGIGDDKDISAFAIYDNCFGLYPMGNIKFGKVYENKVMNVPVHFVVTMIHKGYFYAGTLAVIPENSYNYKLNLNKMTPAAFRAMVNAL